jgi:hypothetical protein
MAVITAQATGNFLTGGTWVGGIVPGNGDTARTSTFTVTIDGDLTGAAAVAILESTSTGHFAVTAARTITAAVNSAATAGSAGVVRCSHSSGTVTITGAVTAGNGRGVDLTGAGTLAIVGNVTGGSFSSSYGAYNNAASGTINITGTITGGTSASGYGAYNGTTGTLNITGNGVGNSTCVPIYNASSGTINITGDVTGGSNSSIFGVYNTTNGVVAITGNATGGSGTSAHGVQNLANGTVTVSGNATGGTGTTAYGVNNPSNGTARVGTAVGNDYGPSGSATVPVPGLFGSNTSGNVTTYKALQFGAHGQSPVGQCAYCEDSAGNNTAKVYHTASTFVVLTDPADATDFPAIANVRSGTTYGTGTYTGTLAVPSANQVSVGVAVDATVGTAVLTATAAENAIWNAVRSGHTTDGTYGDTAEWAGGTPPTVGEIRQEMDSNSTKLANLDATVSSRSTLTAAQVNTEADTALSDVGVTTTVTGRIDTTISSRSNHTAANVRTEMDSNSTKLTDILTDTAEIGTAGAGLTALATQASVNTIDDFLDTEIAALIASVAAVTSAIASLNDLDSTESQAAVAAALAAYLVEAGVNLQAALQKTLAVSVGKAVADAADPTQIIYYAPDNTTARVTHARSGTTRTVS